MTARVGHQLGDRHGQSKGSFQSSIDSLVTKGLRLNENRGIKSYESGNQVIILGT